MTRLRRLAAAASLAGLVAGSLAASPSGAMETLRFRVPGADEDLERTLRASSLLIEARNGGIRNPNDILAAARADYARLVGALYSVGRFGGIVTIKIDGREAAEIDPLATPGRIGTVEVLVRSGPVFTFGQAEVTPLAPGTELPAGFARGERARTAVIEDAVQAAVDGWRAVGNAKAEIAGQEITANHETRRLNARIAVAPGPKLRFGALLIESDSAVSDRRIRKIAGLPSGERFDPEDVERSAGRLRDTGTFRSVALTEAETPNPDGTLDIIAQVADQPPRRFGFGAEIESAEGLTLSAFWLHRNYLGGAERLRFDAEIGGIGGESGGTDFILGVELRRPATPDAQTDAFVKGELARLDEPEFTSDTGTIGIGFRRKLDDHLSVRLGLDYRYSDVTDASGQTTYSQVFLPLGVTLDKREGLLNTNDGYYVDAGLSPFMGLSESEDGARFTFDARAFEDYGEESRFVLAARVQAGSIFGASLTGLPNELRFTSGGGGTVRGHDYQSLDLGLGGGLRSGGRSFLGIQAELRTKVTDEISVVGFYDWAQIGRDSLPGSEGVSHSGAGLGLRYDTGIGPIRLDVAVPVSGPGNPSGFQIYVGIGQAF